MMHEDQFASKASRRTALSARGHQTSLKRRKGGGGRSGRAGGGGGRISGLAPAGRSGTVITGSGPSRTITYTSNTAPLPPAAVISSGQIFAGRTAGGARRKDIYGTRTYGSGYPGISGRGTAGRGFPFFFWPLAWPVALGTGASLAYLNANSEYSNPSNSTRPGGPMMVATFAVNDPGGAASTFRLVSDNSTVLSLVEDLSVNCSSYLKSTSASDTSPDIDVSPYRDSVNSLPRPESVIQYYRASSIALTLDGYNNSASLSAIDGVTDTPLPNLDTLDLGLLVCLNETIGSAAPVITSLTDGSNVASVTSSIIPIGLCILVLIVLGGFALKYGC